MWESRSRSGCWSRPLGGCPGARTEPPSKGKARLSRGGTSSLDPLGPSPQSCHATGPAASEATGLRPAGMGLLFWADLCVRCPPDTFSLAHFQNSALPQRVYEMERIPWALAVNVPGHGSHARGLGCCVFVECFLLKAFSFLGYFALFGGAVRGGRLSDE